MALNELTTLNRRRGNIKSQITKFSAFLTEGEHSANILKAKSDTLKQLRIKFEELKIEYYRTVPDNETDFNTIESALSEIDEDIDNLEVSLKTLLIDFESINDEKSYMYNVNKSVREYPVKLPEIPLPLFSGNYSEFHNFKEQFNSLISDNKQLSSSQKLYYLKSALKGEAKNIGTPDDTFESLFKALEIRYENTRAIVDSHIQSILNFEKMSHESHKELRNLLDKVLSHVRALKSLKFENNNLSEIILINIVLQKLDRETRKQFELSVNSTEVPTWDIFISFLEKRCQILESLNRNASVKQKFHPEHIYKSKAVMLNYNATEKYCPACKSNKMKHPLYKCSVFINLYDTVNKNRIFS